MGCFAGDESGKLFIFCYEITEDCSCFEIVDFTLFGGCFCWGCFHFFLQFYFS